MKRQTQIKTEYPFALRPASREEAGLFYSQLDEAEDTVLGTVGHVRIDFGSSGKGFYHTWWPHNDDQLTPRNSRVNFRKSWMRFGQMGRSRIWRR